jgi:tRNA(fMet)-specific endonuclease VapC
MNLALDTNAYVDFFRGKDPSLSAVRSAQRIYLPFVVLGELRAGFLAGGRTARNEEGLTRFLTSARVEILFADEQTTHHYARLFAQLRRQGAPIPTNDLWIASLVLQHNLILLSQDGHFDAIGQLARYRA